MAIQANLLRLLAWWPSGLARQQQEEQSADATGWGSDSGFPLVINTWGGPFTAATDAAYEVLVANNSAASALDAVVAGCARCEAAGCDGTVGAGGSPDEACETTLDALVMDGATLGVGAVAGLRRVRHAVAVARLVRDRTRHSLLVGDLATRFAVETGGFKEVDLGSDESRARCEAWRRGGCWPNYRKGEGGCEGVGRGQEQGEGEGEGEAPHSTAAAASHDTIAMIAMHASGAMAAATSTNGAAHKVPGRAGDAPVAGSGAYVDDGVGGCGATGDGDEMMRFLPCYQAVESLRRGMAPRAAAEDAVARMLRRYPDLRSGLVVVDRHGRHAGAASGWNFTYAYRRGDMGATAVVAVPPLVLGRADEL